MVKKCYNCREEKDFENPDLFMCQECIDAGERLTAPVAHGLSDGPGNHFTCFARPNPAVECKETFAKMESMGKLSKEQKVQAKRILKDLESRPQKKIDYDKGDKVSD